MLGAVLIILYVVSTVGPYLRYISVGLFTACAAFLIGTLVGLVIWPLWICCRPLRVAELRTNLQVV